MNFENIGRLLVRVTFYVTLINVLLCLGSLNGSVNRVYSLVFGRVFKGLDAIILYVTPLVILFLLLVYVALTYLLKKDKKLNFQLMTYSLFIIWYLTLTYIRLVLNYEH